MDFIEQLKKEPEIVAELDAEWAAQMKHFEDKYGFNLAEACKKITAQRLQDEEFIKGDAWPTGTDSPALKSPA
jgi:hypothetical protein